MLCRGLTSLSVLDIKSTATMYAALLYVTAILVGLYPQVWASRSGDLGGLHANDHNLEAVKCAPSFAAVWHFQLRLHTLTYHYVGHSASRLGFARFYCPACFTCVLGAPGSRSLPCSALISFFHCHAYQVSSLHTCMFVRFKSRDLSPLKTSHTISLITLLFHVLVLRCTVVKTLF